MKDKKELIVGEMLPPTTQFDAMQAQAKTAVDIAKAYPRVLSEVIEDIMSLACADQETAISCHYALEFGRKQIIGESVRFAEIVAYCYGNLHVETAITKELNKSIEAEGTCWDLQRNVKVKKTVTKSIMDKHGKRFADRVVETNKAALVSIAHRNAVFACIPKVLLKKVVEKVKQVALGNDQPIEKQRESCIKAFEDFGITSEEVCKLSKVRKPDDLTVDNLFFLRSSYSSLKDGLVTKADLLKEKAKSTLGEEK